ncbi:glycosyltransferase family 2 protein [Sulfurimonas autotrophica]|uniref:Glycosyl transferase family 2 n=1 Tax=Sulfurimonas autotrophica (strain ATCC BAA-671 / DSM 16294 / JCM 11897 / OK10) TaxID=563040 RepID=E0UUN9_SULAO|nr:glycosyltransferase family 2 protein [Sulfurimonas autotrophica]ADN09543.1 glycosyl transferase family 2 [Sulfurimonas autotrophica DSM 16294]
MNNPLVCICIPNYNNEDTIANTLDSILHQTYENIIIKVFDNVSIDSSMKILKRYEEKYVNISVYQNNENIGGEANFTKCIENLEGDFGAIFHADDLYSPTMVENQIRYLSQNDISAIFVRANLIDDNSNVIGEQFFPDELKNKKYHQFDFKQLFALILKYDNFLITPSVMAKVDIYKNQIKSWNGQKFKTSADLDVWLRFSEIKNIGLITDKLISYRISTASFSYRTKFSRVNPRDMFLVIEKYLNKYSNLNFDQADYEYLKFKDNILVINNKILNSKLTRSDKIVLMNFKVLNKIFCNKQKFKIYIYAVLIKLLLFCGCRTLLVKLIKKVNNLEDEK